MAGNSPGGRLNPLARAVFIHRLGEIRDRTYENQQHRASGLNLLVTAITLWNTRYLDRAIAALRQVETVPDELLKHLSPLGWEHVNLTGDYVWGSIQQVAERGDGFRPLRTVPTRRSWRVVLVVSAYATDPGSSLVPAIKGRAYPPHKRPGGQKLGTIKRNAPCDKVIIVTMDNGSLDAREIWAAPMAAVAARLDIAGSKARERGVLSVGELMKLGVRIWPQLGLQPSDA